METIADLIHTALPRTRLHVPVQSWFQVMRERRALSGLSDERLLDLGIDPDAARAESARPFWDLPGRR